MNKCIIQRDDIIECLIKTKRLKIYEASDKDVDMIEHGTECYDTYPHFPSNCPNDRYEYEEVFSPVEYTVAIAAFDEDMYCFHKPS